MHSLQMWAYSFVQVCLVEIHVLIGYMIVESKGGTGSVAEGAGLLIG